MPIYPLPSLILLTWVFHFPLSSAFLLWLFLYFYKIFSGSVLGCKASCTLIFTFFSKSEKSSAIPLNTFLKNPNTSSFQGIARSWRVHSLCLHKIVWVFLSVCFCFYVYISKGVSSRSDIFHFAWSILVFTWFIVLLICNMCLLIFSISICRYFFYSLCIMFPISFLSYLYSFVSLSAAS